VFARGVLRSPPPPPPLISHSPSLSHFPSSLPLPFLFPRALLPCCGYGSPLRVMPGKQSSSSNQQLCGFFVHLHPPSSAFHPGATPSGCSFFSGCAFIAGCAVGVAGQVLSGPPEQQPLQAVMEVKGVGEVITLKICTLLLHTGREVEAVGWVRNYVEWFRHGAWGRRRARSCTGRGCRASMRSSGSFCISACRSRASWGTPRRGAPAGPGAGAGPAWAPPAGAVRELSGPSGLLLLPEVRCLAQSPRCTCLCPRGASAAGCMVAICYDILAMVWTDTENEVAAGGWMEASYLPRGPCSACCEVGASSVLAGPEGEPSAVPVGGGRAHNPCGAHRKWGRQSRDDCRPWHAKQHRGIHALGGLPALVALLVTPLHALPFPAPCAPSRRARRHPGGDGGRRQCCGVCTFASARWSCSQAALLACQP